MQWALRVSVLPKEQFPRVHRDDKKVNIVPEEGFGADNKGPGSCLWALAIGIRFQSRAKKQKPRRPKFGWWLIMRLIINTARYPPSFGSCVIGKELIRALIRMSKGRRSRKVDMLWKVCDYDILEKLQPPLRTAHSSKTGYLENFLPQQTVLPEIQMCRTNNSCTTVSKRVTGETLVFCHQGILL